MTKLKRKKKTKPTSVKFDANLIHEQILDAIVGVRRDIRKVDHSLGRLWSLHETLTPTLNGKKK